MNDSTCTRLLCRRDADALFELRYAAYRTSPDFIVTPFWLETLNWNEADERANVLGVWDNSALVATMSLAIIHDAAEACQCFYGMALPAYLQHWPAPILTRAATSSRFSGRGLNSLLRSHLIRGAMAGGAQRLFGYVPLSGSRTRLLQTLGYQFFPRADPDSSTPSTLGWAAVWLDLNAHGQQALQYLNILAATEAERYPWSGPALDALKLGNSTR